MNRFRNYGGSLALIIVAIAGCGSEPVDEAEFLEEVRVVAPESEPTSADTEDAGATPASTPPSIQFPAPLFDMGVISADEFTFKEMPVYNHGGRPLTITSIKTQCPCTTGKMKKNTIPPNGVGTLVIKLDPAKVSGFKSQKDLTIFSNDPLQPQIRLTVTATVAGELVLSENEIDFGNVEEGQAMERSIRITQSDSKPVKIGAITSRGSADFLTFEMVEVPASERAVGANPEYDFIARIAEGNRAGRFDTVARVSLETGRNQTMSVPIKLTIHGDYSFSPMDITVRNVKPNEMQEGVTTLTSKVPLEVLGVDSGNPNLKVSYAAGEDPNSYRFDLIVPEKPENRLQKDEIKVTLKVAGKEVVEIIKVVALLAR